MELVSTLFVDIPISEESFRGNLMDISQSVLAGAISQQNLIATHSFGDASIDDTVRDIRVIVRKSNTTPPEIKKELKKIGFQIQSVIRFESFGDKRSREDAWALTELYANQLKGWVLTSYLNFKTAKNLLNSTAGLINIPAAGKRKMTLIAANNLKYLR